MIIRPLLLSAAVGLAAIGAVHSPAAEARGYVSISVGTPAPYYRGYPGRDHRRADQVWVPAHWVSTYRGRVLVPARYVRVQPRYGYDRRYNRGHGRHDYGTRVIYRSSLTPRPLPGGFYHQRGGYDRRDVFNPGYRGW